MPRPRQSPSIRFTKVLGYARVSTEEQSKSGLGLAAQREAIEGEARRRGWREISYLQDEGYSAKSLDRPAVQHALESLSSGEARVLVVAKLDRLSRSLLDFAGLMDLSQREGWSIVALDIGVDTSTAAGEMVAHVMASFAQFERRLISERTRAALAAAKKRGTRLGRPITLPEEVRQRVARERVDGKSLRSIAEGLNTDGIRTARGRWWGTSSVQKVLLSLAHDILRKPEDLA